MRAAAARIPAPKTTGELTPATSISVMAPATSAAPSATFHGIAETLALSTFRNIPLTADGAARNRPPDGWDEASAGDDVDAGPFLGSTSTVPYRRPGGPSHATPPTSHRSRRHRLPRTDVGGSDPGADARPRIVGLRGQGLPRTPRHAHDRGRRIRPAGRLRPPARLRRTTVGARNRHRRPSRRRGGHFRPRVCRHDPRCGRWGRAAPHHGRATYGGS